MAGGLVRSRPLPGSRAAGTIEQEEAEGQSERMEALREYYVDTAAAIMIAIAEAPPEQKQDDELWRQRQTEIRLLEPPLLGEEEEEEDTEASMSPRAVLSPWRQQQYLICGNVFADANDMLRDAVPWAAGCNKTSVSLWVVRGRFDLATMPPLDRDTLVYPVWVHTEATVTFFAVPKIEDDGEAAMERGEQHVWSGDVASWMSVLWMNGERAKGVVVEGVKGNMVVAVLVLGRCEERSAESVKTPSCEGSAPSGKLAVYDGMRLKA